MCQKGKSVILRLRWESRLRDVVGESVVRLASAVRL